MKTDGTETEELLRAWRDAERRLEGSHEDDPQRPALEENARDAAGAYRRRIKRVSEDLEQAS